MSSRPDQLQKFLFEHAPIRGHLVHLDASWRAVLERREYPPVVRELLGELMAAAALLTATLKFEGRLLIQAQGKGPIRLLVAECSSDRTLRGLAQWEGGGVESAPLATLLGGGQMAITIEQRDPGVRAAKAIRYQGVVELEGMSLAHALENYFARSEQLATRLWLAADGSQAAGMLLQQMPGGDAEDESWQHAVHLGATISREELLGLPAKAILHRLYHEDDLRLFDASPVSFRCSCSRNRVEGVLRMLGREEIESILAEQGTVGVDCEFCGCHYGFDVVDAAQLFAAEVTTPAPPARQ